MFLTWLVGAAQHHGVCIRAELWLMSWPGGWPGCVEELGEYENCFVLFCFVLFCFFLFFFFFFFFPPTMHHILCRLVHYYIQSYILLPSCNQTCWFETSLIAWRQKYGGLSVVMHWSTQNVVHSGSFHYAPHLVSTSALLQTVLHTSTLCRSMWDCL